MNRRTFSSMGPLAAVLALAGCQTLSSGGMTLDSTKLWVNSGIDATLAAANAYLLGPPKPTAASATLVNQIIADLERSKAAMNAVEGASDARGWMLQILPLWSNLLPIVAAFLPTGLPALIALAIAVATAFVSALPPPPDAPPEPPVQLRRAAAAYRPRR